MKKTRIALGIGLLALGSIVVLACEDSESDTPTPPTTGFDAGNNNTPDGNLPSTPPDSGNPATNDAGDGGTGEPPLLTPDFYVNPTTGLDTNDGKSTAAPFKTLCKAREALTAANQVIGLMDGLYGNDSQRPIGWMLSYPCGPTFAMSTVLQAVNQGQAVVSVPLIFNAGGTVRGIKIETERPAVGGPWVGYIQNSGGDLTMRGVSVGEVSSSPSAKAAPLTVSSGKVTMFPGGLTNYMTTQVPNGRGLSFAFVSGELVVEGGTFDDSAAGNTDTFCNPLFEGGGKVTLKGVTVRHKGTIHRVTNGTASYEGQSVLENRSIAVNVGCTSTIGLLSMVNVTVKDSTLRGGSAAIENEPGPVTGTLTVTNTTIENAISAGIDLASIGALTLKVRGSQVKSTGTNGIGVRVGGAVIGDLGKTGDLGGNTFTGSTTTNLRVETTGGVVNAVGNTWTASQQGADAQGKYAAALVTGPVLSGVNYTILSAAQSIQF